MSSQAPHDGETPHRGHQRDDIRMTAGEVTAFLAEQRTIVMSTIAPDGTIHSVAMWYGFADGILAMTTKAKSQKAVNLARDPRITCLGEAGSTYGELRGVEIVGRAELTGDPAVVWAAAVSNHERHHGPLTPEGTETLRRAMRNRVAILIHPDKVVSWDHRKLA
jgi:PPOX class probable F420-dependent enzyme